jgi:hypothetical protein
MRDTVSFDRLIELSQRLFSVSSDTASPPTPLPTGAPQPCHRRSHLLREWRRK